MKRILCPLIDALAGKPVMDGKAVPFEKFGGIDVLDIEVKGVSWRLADFAPV